MKLSVKIAGLLTILSVISAGLVGYLAYYYGRKTIEKRTFNRLVSTNLLKEKEFGRWVRDAERSLRELARRPSIRQYVESLNLYDRPSLQYQLARTKIYQGHLTPNLEEEEGFFELFILRNKDGQVAVSTNDKNEGKFRRNEHYFIQGRSRTVVQSAYYSLSYERPMTTIGTPIKDRDGKTIGVVAGHMDLAEMSAIMAQGRGNSSSEQTYLVNEFNFFVTESRFASDLSLKRALHTKGVDDCLRGKSGVGMYYDYRGVPVVGAYHWMTDWKLCILTEVDQVEAFAPIVALGKSVIGIGAGVALFAVVLGIFFSRTITGPVRRLVKSAEEVGRGNLHYRSQVAGGDEIGQLSRAFDQMTQDLKATTASREELNKEVAERRLVEEELRGITETLEKRVVERTRDLEASRATALNMMEDARDTRRQAEGNLKRLAALREIGLATTSSLDLRAVLDVLMDKIGSLLPNLATEVWLFDRESRQLERIVCGNLDGKDWMRRKLLDTPPLLKAALEQKAPLFVSNVQTDPRIVDPSFFRKHGLVSYLGVSLIAKGEVLGVITFMTREEHQFSKEESEFLTTLAGQAAIAIQNSQLFEQITNQSLQLEKDITERKQAEEVLRQSEAKFYKLFEFAPEAILAVNRDGHIALVNTRAESLFGYTREELLGRSVEMLIPDRLRNGHVTHRTGYFSHPNSRSMGSGFKLHGVRKDGHEFPAEISLNPIETEKGILVTTTILDVSNLKRAEEERDRLFAETKRNLEYISALYSVTSAASESLDMDAVMQEAIKKVTEIFHFDATRIFLFDPQENELHLRASLETNPEFFAGTRTFRRGQGLVGRVADTGEALIFEDVLSDPRYQELSQSKLSRKGKFSFFAGIPIKVKKRPIGVLVCVGKDARLLTPNEVQLVTSMANQVGGAVENAQLFEQTREQTFQLEMDITKRKQVEKQLRQANAELARGEKKLRGTLSDLEESHKQLKAVQSQLIQAEKLESVGTLAAGVAHEVKNPLTIMLQGIHYLSKHLPANGDNVAMALQDMDNAVKRANSIVKGLLDFSAVSESSLTTEELNSVVEQSLSLVKHELARSRVNAVRELSEDLPPVRLDRNKMEQVFVNVFMNAIHAMPEGGTLTIKTYTKQLRKIIRDVGSRKADHFKVGEIVVMAEVEDTGTGIPKDKLAEIFDPFFTTKSTGKGTGLGLTVTKKIIDLHEGTIDIGNRKEGGVRASIMFKAQGGNDHE